MNRRARFAVTTAFFVSVVMPQPAVSIERKTIDDVDVNAFISETQLSAVSPETMSSAWWLPIEFWETVLLQDPSTTAEQRQDIWDVLRPYSHLAVVHANISKFGSFDFFDRTRTRELLRISYTDSDGKKMPLVPIEEVDPDLEILLGQMKPVLGAAMGNMGQSLHFFTLNDRNSRGHRMLSPYETGKLTIEFRGSDGELLRVFDLETPLDALFVPRVCPNGKPAHVSWKVCPWDGSELPE